MVKNSSRSEQGRKNKAAGARFERKVRSDLESKGWIVSKWMNNVELGKDTGKGWTVIKLIPAKHKFRGPGIPMAIGTGFPDFIIIGKIFEGTSNIVARQDVNSRSFGHLNNIMRNMVFGVEAKSNGFLTKEEKEKCRWYLTNNIFSKVLIAKKGSKRGEIIYEEFK